MTEALKTVWHTTATVAPKVLLFLAILAAGWFVAKLVGNAVSRLLMRVGVDRLLERAGMSKIRDPHRLAGKAVYLAGLLLVLQLAFGVFGPNPVSSLITAVIAYLPRIAVALALVVVAATVAQHVKALIADLDLDYTPILARTAQAFIVGLGVIAALAQVNVANTVTVPVLVAVLGTVAGILVVGVGGGLIKPAQARWETALGKAEAAVTAPTVDPVETSDPVAHTATVTVTTRPLD